MEFQVTQEHIARAIALHDLENITRACPVALALRDTGFDFDAIGYVTVERGGAEIATLSRNARELTDLFSDQWKETFLKEPLTITLTYIPKSDEVLKSDEVSSGYLDEF